jgi:RNA polymerase sigma-70 factor (ECF subfamily)
MLASASDANDLLQDVFVEAWQAVRAYDAGRASVRTWLLVRTRSRALDRMGRRGREAAAQALLTRAQVSASSATRLEHGVAVRHALAALDADVLQTLELRYYAGMRAAEIAACMQVPEGTVRSRLARGLRQLGELLGDDKGNNP